MSLRSNMLLKMISVLFLSSAALAGQSMELNRLPNVSDALTTAQNNVWTTGFYLQKNLNKSVDGSEVIQVLPKVEGDPEVGYSQPRNIYQLEITLQASTGDRKTITIDSEMNHWTSNSSFLEIFGAHWLRQCYKDAEFFIEFTGRDFELNKLSLGSNGSCGH